MIGTRMVKAHELGEGNNVIFDGDVYHTVSKVQLEPPAQKVWVWWDGGGQTAEPFDWDERVEVADE
jgi:hypothetical protein